jgi:FkbM family methyltransferase
MKIVKGWAFPDEDDFMANEMKEDGTYQLSHLMGALDFCKGFDTVVDGGAHIGTWAHVLAKRFARVIAFEPSHDTFECLQHNMAMCKVENVIMRNQALGREPGRVRLTLEGFERAIAMKNTGARFTRPGGDIECITLDSMELESLDFLKLDIEGGEPDALLGAVNTLAKFKPVVLFEDKYLWKRYGYPRNKPHEILTSLGAQKLTRLSMDEVWGWPNG